MRCHESTKQDKAEVYVHKEYHFNLRGVGDMAHMGDEYL
jgi:hypothetical protein